MARQSSQAFKLGRVERDTLHEQIYRELRRAIMAGAVRPRQPLSYRGLAEALGTSPMPVRDAVRRLITERAIEALPNGAITIPDFTDDQIDEIYKIRISLEGLATEEAAAKATPKLIKELYALEEQLETVIQRADLAKYTEANWRFHFAIYSAAELPQLKNIIEQLWLQIGPSMWRQAPFEHGLAISDNHRGAIEALAKGDGLRARDAIVADLRVGREAMKVWVSPPAESSLFPTSKRGRPKRTGALEL